VLDVGSGLAQFTRAMARAAGPHGRLVGIEADEGQMAEALRQAGAYGEAELAEPRRGDAMALPLREDEWASFDVAHARFILEHVADPLAAVRQMVAAVRPGGRIVLADDDHDVLRLWPEPPGFESAWRAYMRTYDRLGNDPYVGRRLVALLHDAGALPRRNNWIFFGGCSGGPTFDAITSNLVGILDGARGAILDRDLLPRDVFDAGLDAFRTWSHRPDAALWFAICWAEGVRPSAGP
jgi:SAM-dependent methyltransferase